MSYFFIKQIFNKKVVDNSTTFYHYLFAIYQTKIEKVVDNLKFVMPIAT